MNDRPSANFDLDELLHPASAFDHPSEVVNDPDLTLNEKRAILASWASDACAVEAAPELRSSPSGTPVRFDDIMEALRNLDKQVNGDRYRRARHNRIFQRHRGNGQGGEAPRCNIDTVVADSLKVLDPKRPIREADIVGCLMRQKAPTGQIVGEWLPCALT
jgi:hypothetical protein